MALSAFLPQDRVRALARNEQLSDHTIGSALFADISGFTALTEALKNATGARRGAEELTHYLDTIYTTLIDEVERYGGSVLVFAGDSITCWFDENDGPSAPRSTVCAFAMQTAMSAFSEIHLPKGPTTELTLKVAIATSPARRFVVGNRNIHYLDTLGGATVARTAIAEHLAAKGDILVDKATVEAVNPFLIVQEWRTDSESGESFAVVSEFREQIPPVTFPDVSSDLSDAEFKAWMHPVLHDRETSDHSSFQTGFRPCTVLFIRFLGIDYDVGDAQANLDKFIRQTQDITDRYEGVLLQLIIGDKGSYIYICFGAIVVHEDDARRAVLVASKLIAASNLQIHIGISQGVILFGVYGGLTRRTYGALGDDVNLAARLMQTALPGEILVSGRINKQTAKDFVFEPRPPLPMKGKAEPIPVFAVMERRQQRAIRLQEPNYALPMVGRQRELQVIDEKLDLALQGQSQVIGIVAEAGLGKSRLAAEVIRAARSKGFAGYGGAYRSDAVNTPYEAWKPIRN